MGDRVFEQPWELGVKIEIGESLIYSWLRHVQGCIVTQMNWRPSPTWSVVKECELRERFDAIRSSAAQESGLQIFKNGDFRQFIRQAEIDVFGIRWNCDSTKAAVFAVDSAFHEFGCQYGNADETVGRVIKKLVRTAFAIESYMDVSEASIIFATPKMAEPVRQDIERRLVTIEGWFAEQAGLITRGLQFRIIANADFSSEILAPVLEQIDTVADTGELFMRAQQLCRVCDRNSREGASRAKIERPARATNEEGGRIGEHVRSTMKELAESGRLTAPIVGDLLDARYCKAKFNLGLPFLKPVDRAVPLSRQRIDSNGYGRYWKQPLRIGNHEFLMCCQWFIWQRDAFDAWVRDVTGVGSMPNPQRPAGASPEITTIRSQLPFCP
jgi:hypothetical protein